MTRRALASASSIARFLVDANVLNFLLRTKCLTDKNLFFFFFLSTRKCHFVGRIWTLRPQLSFTGCGVLKSTMACPLLQWFTLILQTHGSKICDCMKRTPLRTVEEKEI